MAELAREEEQLAERLRTGCRELPTPAPADPFEHTLERMPAELTRQRDQHLAFVAAAEGGHE
jgi:hypothetical protein